MLQPGQFNEVQFQYDRPETGGKPPHRIRAIVDGQSAGGMVWTSKEISVLDVHPRYQRNGIATGMWNEAHRMAEQDSRIPKPRHSRDRTDAGDAWARSVGGSLPRRLMNED